MLIQNVVVKAGIVFICGLICVVGIERVYRKMPYKHGDKQTCGSW